MLTYVAVQRVNGASATIGQAGMVCEADFHCMDPGEQDIAVNRPGQNGHVELSQVCVQLAGDIHRFGCPK